MPLVPLDIPAGVYRNGTEYQAKGRWFDSNLVRWRDGLLEPVGGWKLFDSTGTTISGKARGGLAWRDNSSTRFLALGTSEGLYASQGGLFYDVTPFDLAAGREDTRTGLGFGVGPYGQEDWGTARTTSQIDLSATTWSMDNWGQNLVACATSDGKIYEWPLNLTLGSELVTNGDFAAGTDWTLGTGWAIGSGVASWTGTTAANIEQTISVDASRTYQLQIDLIDPDNDANPATIPSAKVDVELSSDITPTVSAQVLVVGTNTITFTTDPTTTSLDIRIYPASDAEPNLDIDNVSLKLSPKATVVANSPENCVGVVVTNERHLVALGAGGNKRRIAWSDQEDNTTWSAAASNLAGDLDLETAGRIRCARRVGNDILIWTDVDVHLMRYLGPPYVYSIERIGTACGIIGPRAVTVSGNTAVWLSESGFWTYDGGVKPLQCDAIIDVTDNMQRDQQAKTYGSHNSEFGEFWFFYPSLGSNENNKYIVWNYRYNFWYVGELDRTCWIDQGVFDNPIAVDADSNVYEHEIGWTDDGATRVGNVYAVSGPIELGQGDRFAVVDRIIPDDYTTLPSIKATIGIKNTPEGTYADTEYSFDESDGYVDVRLTARQMRVKIEATRDDGFKFGTIRMNLKQGSRR